MWHLANSPTQELGALWWLRRSLREWIMQSGFSPTGKRAPRLVGRLTADDAIRRLIAGSGLVAEFRDDIVFIRGAIVAEATGTSQNDVVVTGTRIRGGVSASPFKVLGAKQIRDAGQKDLGEVARSLPQNFNGGQNPEIGVGAPGDSQNFDAASSLNLRGLGADATLTLLNGHRLAYDGAAQAIDISAIPLAAVDRIEIVPDGASALYGSDAVGGVANIILKRDFQGLDVSARVDVPTDGGGIEQQYNAAAGTTWRGGGLLATYYFDRGDPITAGQRRITNNLAPSTSGGVPRSTAMVPLMRSLPSGGVQHPVLSGRGWWRRPSRLTYPAAPRPAPMREYVLGSPERPSATPLLICGATGTLGRAFAEACRQRDIAHVLTSRSEFDLCESGAALDRIEPWAVVNATGWVRVDDAEEQPDAFHRINAKGAANLARACADRGIPTVSFSSDLVFDGDGDAPYREHDAPAPLNAYGRSKAAMEQLISGLPGTHLMIRTAAFFSPHETFNFAQVVRDALRANRPFEAAADQIVSPTYVPQLVDRVLDLLIDDADGIWHLANDDILSWFDFARRIAAACGLDADLVGAISGRQQPALRPRYSGLTSTRGATLGPLDTAIAAFAGHADQALAPDRRSLITTGDTNGYQ